MKTLMESIGPGGRVVAYYAPFEGSRLGELAEAFPRHARRLLSIKNRMWDMAGPFRAGFYVHPDFQGSRSLKSVLPALVPGMTYERQDPDRHPGVRTQYDGMTISDGGEASIAYLNLMEGQLSAAESKKLIRALRDYCGQDTLAMVKLLDVLHKQIA